MLWTEPLSNEESLSSCNGTGNKYGYLVVDDKWHEITVGETKIGCDASICSIVLEDATLSMLHAVIESEGPEDSFVYDANNPSKTKIGKMTLKPQCRYKINDNDTILMGDKVFQYKVLDHKVESFSSKLSLFNVLNFGKSDEKTITNIANKNNVNAFGISDKLVLNAGVKISDKPEKPYYILASELFNTDIFSQDTQCDIENVQNESFKYKNWESVDSDDDDDDDDIHNMKTQSTCFGDSKKKESKLNVYKRIDENTEKITESYLNHSDTFDFVRKNESKHFLSCMCKSISDDIFELTTQSPFKINDSQKTVEKAENFKSFFSSRLFKSDKSEKEIGVAGKTESQNESCVTRNDNLNIGGIDSEFFDDDKDEEELCEIMRNISPESSQDNDCVIESRKNIENSRLKKSIVPDKIFDVQTQVCPDLSNMKNCDRSKSKSLDSEHDESKIFKVSLTNGKEEGLSKTERGLKHSNQACDLITQKVKMRNTKFISKRKLKKEAVENVNNGRVNSDDNISKFHEEDKKISDQETTQNSELKLPTRTYSFNSDNASDESERTFQKEDWMRGKSVSSPLNDICNSHFEMGLSGESSNEKVEKVKSPMVDETLNELWEKNSNCSRVSSNKTLSDLDINELKCNPVKALESDTEEHFMAFQGMHLLNKSNREKLDSEIQAAVRKTKMKFDIWKENWQDFIFTQNIPDEERRKSESESTDKTESDIVASTKPIPDIELHGIIETSSEDFFNMEENSNESECLIKKNIEDESSSNGGIDLTEEDFDEFKCESPVLLQSNIQTDDNQDEEERELIGGGEENVNKEYEPNEIRAVSGSDETDCEEELKTRKISFVSKIPDFGTNGEREETLPWTSYLRNRKDKYLETDKIAKENTSLEKCEDSPLKRTRIKDVDTTVPKKKSRNTRKKKEEDGAGGKQLRSRGVKACKGRLEYEERKGKSEVKDSSRKRAVNTDIPSRKTLDFVSGSSSNITYTRGSSWSKSKWKVENSTSVKVVFTGFNSENHNKTISRLGGLKVNDLDEESVLVTDKVRRTVKFLSAVALGLPIVSPKWLISSSEESKFLNPWNFLLEDEASEERWSFNLKNSIKNWKKDKLLEGFNVFATENTKPPVPELLSIVKCCGGMAFTSYPEIWPEKSIVLTCLEDKKSWPHYKYRSVKILHYEFLLSGVLKHTMDFKTYKLR